MMAVPAWGLPYRAGEPVLRKVPEEDAVKTNRYEWVYLPGHFGRALRPLKNEVD